MDDHVAALLGEVGLLDSSGTAGFFFADGAAVVGGPGATFVAGDRGAIAATTLDVQTLYGMHVDGYLRVSDGIVGEVIPPESYEPAETPVDIYAKLARLLDG